MQTNDKKTEAAIKTLLEWLGENPSREGLKETPKRVVERYKKIFSGYYIDLKSILKKPTILAKKGMGMVLVPSIQFVSFCEHHFLPMIGEINIAYLPSQKLAGIGTIIKITKVFTNRLQIQENLTIQIAKAIEKYLEPKAVAININAKHYCIDSKETGKLYGELSTYHFLGVFQTDKTLQNQFLNIITKKSSS